MSPEPLFNVQRRERLMEELRRHGAVRVRDLAPVLGVSELTVRRDIAALAEQNLLTRVHGGATLPTRLGPAPRRPRSEAVRFTVGMVVPSLDYYWPPIVEGARRAAGLLGVSIRLRGSGYDPDEDRRQITRLVDSGEVQGLLLAPSLDADAMIAWIGGLPVPVVLVERLPPRWTPTPRQLDWVRSDHALGIEMAVRHLHQHGHRRIGLVLTPDSPTSAHLARGWAPVCADLQLPDDLVLHQSVRHEEVIGDMLRRCARSKITALVVHSDHDALALARYCRARGVAVPDDLALVSYDDETAHLAEPALTAVRPPKNHVGRVAVELMVSRLMEGSHRPSQRVLVAPELVIRGSSLPR